MPDIRKPVALLIILLIVCVVAFVAAAVFGGGGPAGSPGATGKTQPPPLTPTVQAELAASKGFQYLVSYTDRGFEPATLTIKKGETIRFTNNSSEGLRIAATGSAGAVYPAGSGNECGPSSFDSCVTLKPGEFWEFTFTDAGTWSYQNNSDTKMSGVLTVR